ncbi:MAG: hypothetical protein AUH29_16220 [Candidatus Rokubacteria bacterium 13_1_40CM_69_27]|nr:MAG: hypothetical protein AUH29_16220 [Candidatus Rokubacteria bacterium 13_1_40CM_69_27]
MRRGSTRFVRAGGLHHFGLTADKTAGALTLALALEPGAPARALRVDARSTGVAEGGVRIEVDLAGEPRQLGGLWPAAVPPPASLAARSELSILRDGQMTATGRLTVVAAATPAVIDFASRYDARGGRLTVPRYALDWGADVHLEGQAEVTAGLRISGTARGTVDGSPFGGRATYETTSGALDGEVTVESFSMLRVSRRLGASPAPGEATARSVVARFSSVAGAHRPTARIDLLARGLTATALRSFPLDAALEATVTLAPDADPRRLARVNAATLTLTRQGESVGVLTGASRGDALWPLAVDGKVDDLGRVAPALPLAAMLSGSARIVGEVRSADSLEFQGTLTANLPRAQVVLGAPVVLTNVRATVPVASGETADTPAGSVTVEHVAGYGLALGQATSTARIADGRLLLPDISYTQYGGQGRGWLEAALDGRPAPFRTRLEGQGVDLARFVRESGSNVAHLAGKVRYLASVQYTTPDGLVALVRTDSEDGGEVGIDAIERLLESAAVQAESSGVLRLTLENLRVFQYESLEGELRLSRGDGRVDLTLRGKKRLGIFPAPVEAINVRNVPLAVLARTFTRGTTP